MLNLPTRVSLTSQQRISIKAHIHSAALLQAE